eukprot:5800-Eustigmatos_ZCMA.PRE.1
MQHAASFNQLSPLWYHPQLYEEAHSNVGRFPFQQHPDDLRADMQVDGRRVQALLLSRGCCHISVVCSYLRAILIFRGPLCCALMEML